MVRLPVRSVFLITAGAISACGGHGDRGAPAEEIGESRSAIYDGTASTAEEDFSVMLYAPRTARGEVQGSAVLVAPTLLLTARHVVTTGLLELSQTQCILGTDAIPAENFVVKVGRDRATLHTVQVKRIVFDYDSDSCANDIAGVELMEPITGIKIPPLALDQPPAKGDPVVAIGWGLVNDTEQPEASQRMRGEGIVLGLEADTYTTTTGKSVYAPDGFIVTSINSCSGDSGGPLMDKRGALLGTMYGIFQEASTWEEGASCRDAVSAYVPLYRHASFVERLFQSIGKMPPRAGKAPPAELGGSCGANNECNSNYCVSVGPRAVCSKGCKADADCGAGLACTDTGTGTNVCLDATNPPAADASACAVSAVAPHSERGASFVPALLVMGAAATAVSRRRSRARRGA